jgi:hypothetical protein
MERFDWQPITELQLRGFFAASTIASRTGAAPSSS